MIEGIATTLSLIEFHRIYALLVYSAQVGVLKCNRIDIALDFPIAERRLPDCSWRELYDSGEISGFRTARFYETQTILGDPSKTVYFGSRESELCVRVYDKDDCNRWECEFKGYKAQELGLAIARLSPDQFFELPSYLGVGVRVGDRSPLSLTLVGVGDRSSLSLKLLGVGDRSSLYLTSLGNAI